MTSSLVHMKRAIFMAILGVGLFSATMVFAQTTVVAPAPALMPAYQACPTLTANLYRGLNDYYTGGQVTALQQFLSTRGYYQPITGYFGALTYTNVVAFQREQGIYPLTGGVGPLTRAAIVRVCGGTVSTLFSATPTAGTAPLNVNFSVGELPAGSNMAAIYIDFGDGQQANPQTIYCFKAPCIPSMTSQHTYTVAGTYTAKLMQNNNYCAPGMYCTAVYREPTQLATASVVVSGGATNISYDFSASPTSGAVPLPVNFTMSTSITNTNASFVVDFGDGQYGVMQAGSCVGIAAIQGGQGGIRCNFTTSHAYSARGTYTATLSPYIACMYSNPRCMIATMPLGNVTVTVF